MAGQGGQKLTEVLELKATLKKQPKEIRVSKSL